MRKLANHKPSRSPLLLAQPAAHLRAAPTPSEAALWAALRTCCCGVAFRRQVPLIDRFIAYVFGPSVRLVIEVDGGCHARRRAADARRDIALLRIGYRTLRFTPEVTTSLQSVLERIRAAVES